MTIRAVIAAVSAQYLLDGDGIHDLGHWERVRENGLRLAGLTGARTDVVELFACFHDACRHNNSHDPGHGARGAGLARAFAGSVFDLDSEGLDLLVEACTGHTSGGTVAEITVATCWVEFDGIKLLPGSRNTALRHERIVPVSGRVPAPFVAPSRWWDASR